jgi:hypothetical protein
LKAKLDRETGAERWQATAATAATKAAMKNGAGIAPRAVISGPDRRDQKL